MLLLGRREWHKVKRGGEGRATKTWVFNLARPEKGRGGVRGDGRQKLEREKKGKRKNSREEEEGSNCALFLLEGIVGAQKNGGLFWEARWKHA